MESEKEGGNWRILDDVEADEDGEVKHKTYRMDNFIQIRSNNKYRTIGYILGAILIVASIIIILTTVWTRNEEFSENSNSDDTPSDESVYLVLSGNTGLTSFNIDTKNRSTFYKFNQNVSVYDTNGDDKVFWSDSNTSKIWYFSISDMKQNSSVEFHGVLLQEQRFTAQDMTYDHIGHNLYVVDKVTGILIVINIRTKFHDILLTDLVNPHHIDVDPYQGLIFILQKYDSILKGSMDGTSTMTIFASRELSAMTVDRKKRRIYCLSDIQGIKSFDYDGKDIETYPIDATDIIDLAIVNDKLFWLWEHNRNVNETHHLVECKIKNGICEDHSMHVIDPIGDFGSIKVIHSHPKEAPSDINPCQKDNGGCEHLCLLIPNGKRSCSCKLGWQLNPDKKTCQEVKEFMLYIFLGYFRGRILDISRKASIDVIWPTPTGINLNSIPFDYDVLNDNVYFSNGSVISTMKLRTNLTSQTVLLKASGTVKDIAFDWLTNNLYYLQNKYLDGYKIIAFNVNLGSKFNKTLIHMKPEQTDEFYLYPISDQGGGSSLTIHPKLGYLFYATSSYYKNGFIYKSTMNGTQLHVHADSTNALSNHKLLAIDYAENKLYWFQEELTSVIHTDLEFNDRKVMHASVLQIPQGMSLHRKYMYISSFYDIWRVDKATGKVAARIVPILDNDRERIVAGMKVVSEATALSMKKEEHPCNNKENGVCEQLCFLHNGNDAVCDCRDGEILGNDHHCHVDVSK